MQFVPMWTCINKSRKLHALAGEDFKFWVLCLTLAQEHDHIRGTLPDLDSVAFALHLEMTVVKSRMATLVRSRLIDEEDDVYRIHDWSDWKHRPDPSGAERQRRYREKWGPNGKPSVTPVTSHNVIPLNHDVTPQLTSSKLTATQNPPLPPPAKPLPGNDDVVVAFGRSALGDRFDLEAIPQKLSGFRAAGYPDDWIRDAILCASCAGAGQISSYMNTCLRRWKKRGGPDPEEVAKAKPSNGPTNMPGGPTEAELLKIREEMAGQPRVSKAEFERRLQRGG
jgi:hypothetical protein